MIVSWQIQRFLRHKGKTNFPNSKEKQNKIQNNFTNVSSSVSVHLIGPHAKPLSREVIFIARKRLAMTRRMPT